MTADTNALPPLWQCPRCGAKLVTPNMSHSCGRFELEPLFARSEPKVFVLYRRLETLVQTCGPVVITPQKTRIVFQDRVRFMGIVPRKAYLQVHFWFMRRHDSPRFNKIEVYPNAFVHYIYIHDEAVFDDELSAWVREAYAVGQQKHLQRPSG